MKYQNCLASSVLFSVGAAIDSVVVNTYLHYLCILHHGTATRHLEIKALLIIANIAYANLLKNFTYKNWHCNSQTLSCEMPQVAKYLNCLASSVLCSVRAAIDSVVVNTYLHYLHALHNGSATRHLEIEATQGLP